MTNKPEITVTSWIMMASLGLIWGGTFLATEIALEGITPFWLASSRTVLGALATVSVWQMQGRKLFAAPAPRQQYMLLVVIAVLSSSVPFALLAWGQQYVTSGFAGVSMASTALIVLPLAHFMIPGERTTPLRTMGFLVGFAGVVVLIGLQAFDSSGSTLELWGRLACVGAAACYAISSIQLRQIQAINPIGLSAILLLLGAVFIVPLAWVVEGPPVMPDPHTLGVLAFLGLVPTAAASFLRVYVVRTAGPVFLSLLNYQVPIWSILLGAFFLNETLPSSLIWATSLILVGVGLTQFGAIRRLFTKP
ncbi:MAG: drug/metabolite transporter (DMT)-like permease [Paracoccaceae bacterium]|jgi:drug/metabolite transporter (DMT)-like permease